MIVQRFLKWSTSADVAKRSAGASALARAYLQSDMDIDERCAADAAMALLLDDPSPKVRFALAEALASSSAAPLHIVTALARDQHDVASIVIARSPVLRDCDLVERVAVAESRIQTLIARRPEVSNKLAQAICEFGSVGAVVVLLGNRNANISAGCLSTVADKHIAHASVRGALLERSDLPPALRLRVLNACRDALSASSFVGRVLGEQSAKHVSGDAAQNAIVFLASGRMDGGILELIDVLRSTGALTTKLLIRAVCAGKIDFVARILADLSGQAYSRVTAILVDQRENHLRALLSSAGLAESVHALFVTAIRIWRDVANGRLHAGAQEVTRMVLEDFERRTEPQMRHANDDIIALLRSIHLEMIRQNARRHALDLAAA